MFYNLIYHFSVKFWIYSCLQNGSSLPPTLSRNGGCRCQCFLSLMAHWKGKGPVTEPRLAGYVRLYPNTVAVVAGLMAGECNAAPRPICTKPGLDLAGGGAIPRSPLSHHFGLCWQVFESFCLVFRVFQFACPPPPTCWCSKFLALDNGWQCVNY